MCSEQDVVLQPIPTNSLIMEGFANPVTQYINNDMVCDKGLCPSRFHVWSYSQQQWITTKPHSQQQVDAIRLGGIVLTAPGKHTADISVIPSHIFKD